MKNAIRSTMLCGFEKLWWFRDRDDDLPFLSEFGYSTKMLSDFSDEYGPCREQLWAVREGLA